MTLNLFNMIIRGAHRAGRSNRPGLPGPLPVLGYPVTPPNLGVLGFGQYGPRPGWTEPQLGHPRDRAEPDPCPGRPGQRLF